MSIKRQKKLREKLKRERAKFKKEIQRTKEQAEVFGLKEELSGIRSERRKRKLAPVLRGAEAARKGAGTFVKEARRTLGPSAKALTKHYRSRPKDYDPFAGIGGVPTRKGKRRDPITGEYY